MSKRRDLSVLEKVNILRKYDTFPPISQREAASKLEISQPLLCKILKSREELEAVTISNENTSRKRKRFGKDEQVETALLEWFEYIRDKNESINGPILRAKAEKLAKQLGKEDFVATEGWFSRFKNRRNLVYRKLRGEQDDANGPAAESWIKDVWPSLIEQYSPDEIFNADETGIYYQALPETTYVFKNEASKEFKMAKDRIITVLCCCSMSGKKKKLLVIGKSKNPICFKNVKNLPVSYFANKNAWMTSQIFKEWLVKWDLSLNCNILLLMRNCTAHNVDVSLRHIRIVFLPSNTSLIQPLDQGIIRTFKAYYRNEMRQRILEQIECNVQSKSAAELSKKTDLLSALHLLKQSWDSVAELTVSNCFKKGGFVPKSEPVEVLCDLPFPNDLSKEAFEEWMGIDSSLTTVAPLTEEDTCNNILKYDNLELSSSDEESEDEISLPSKKEVIDALATIRQFVQCKGTEKHFNDNLKFEKLVRDLLVCNSKESSMTCNFSKYN